MARKQNRNLLHQQDCNGEEVQTFEITFAKEIQT
jgi:hypothetical protein